MWHCPVGGDDNEVPAGGLGTARGMSGESYVECRGVECRGVGDVVWVMSCVNESEGGNALVALVLI